MHPFDEEWNTGIQPKLSYFHLRSLYHSSVIFLQQANCSMALQISNAKKQSKSSVEVDCFFIRLNPDV